MPRLLAERGYQVLYVSLRGTGGSGGEFDGFTNNPADADGTLSWLPVQPWFGGVLATWGASYLGFVQWELSARDIPEWKIAVIQDAPSEFADQFMYPGGGFALGNALGWVQIVDRMFRTDGGMGRQLFGVFTGPRAMRRAVLRLPVADADIALTGRRVRWFQEWSSRPGRPYWRATDHRAKVDRIPRWCICGEAGTTSSSLRDARRLRCAAGSRPHCPVGDRALRTWARPLHAQRDA